MGGGGGNGGRRWHYRVNLTYRVVDGWRKVRDFKVSEGCFVVFLLDCVDKNVIASVLKVGILR